MIKNFSPQSTIAESIVSSKYNQQIDIMKGLAILLVVAGHIIQFSVVGGETSHPTYLWIYKFHMDVFFFCSGCLFSGLDMEKGILSGITIFQKKMTRLLIPYITWTFIIFCTDHKPFILENILEYFVFRPKYGLWFLHDMMLYCLFVLAIFVTFRYIPKKFRQLFENVLLLSFMIVLAFFGRLHFFFYLMGILFVRNFIVPKLITNKWVLIVTSIMFLVSIILSEIPTILVGFSAIIVFYNIGRTYYLPDLMKNAIMLFGKYSMPIFLVHFFIILNIQIRCATDPFALFALSITSSIVISYFCIALYKLSLVGILPTILWGERE